MKQGPTEMADVSKEAIEDWSVLEKDLEVI
jgi:hypothetical protein